MSSFYFMVQKFRQGKTFSPRPPTWFTSNFFLRPPSPLLLTAVHRPPKLLSSFHPSRLEWSPPSSSFWLPFPFPVPEAMRKTATVLACPSGDSLPGPYQALLSRRVCELSLRFFSDVWCHSASLLACISPFFVSEARNPGVRLVLCAGPLGLTRHSFFRGPRPGFPHSEFPAVLPPRP